MSSIPPFAAAAFQFRAEVERDAEVVIEVRSREPRNRGWIIGVRHGPDGVYHWQRVALSITAVRALLDEAVKVQARQIDSIVNTRLGGKRR